MRERLHRRDKEAEALKNPEGKIGTGSLAAHDSSREPAHEHPRERGLEHRGETPAHEHSKVDGATIEPHAEPIVVVESSAPLNGATVDKSHPASEQHPAEGGHASDHPSTTPDSTK